jgi:hypothetical protein
VRWSPLEPADTHAHERTRRCSCSDPRGRPCIAGFERSAEAMHSLREVPSSTITIMVLNYVTVIYVRCAEAIPVRQEQVGPQSSRHSICTWGDGCRAQPLLKGSRPWKQGRACKKHFTVISKAAAKAAALAVTAAAAAPESANTSPHSDVKQTRKRRAESDPGEFAALQTRSRSAAAALLGLAKSVKRLRSCPPPPVQVERAPSASTPQQRLPHRQEL